MIHADHKQDVTEIPAGNIGAIIGLKKSTTGDTLCDENNPIILESIKFPEPVQGKQLPLQDLPEAALATRPERVYKTLAAIMLPGPGYFAQTAPVQRLIMK